jgi:class 3 adenylate cyclase
MIRAQAMWLLCVVLFAPNCVVESAADFLHKGKHFDGYLGTVSSALGLDHDDFSLHDLDGSDSKKLMVFWSIGLASYLMSAIFSYGVWWWFVKSKGSNSRAIVVKQKSVSTMSRYSVGSIGDMDEDSDLDIDMSVASRHSLLSGGMRAAGRKAENVDKKGWAHETMPERLQIGALTLLLIGCLMVVYMMMRFWGRPECAPFEYRVHIPEMLVLACLMAMVIVCAKNPSQRLYWPTLLLWLLYIPACQLPPFNLSCTTLEKVCRNSEHWRVVQAVSHADCSLQGQTAQQIFLTVFLLLPWLLPEQRMLHMMWVWIAAVYVFWSIAYIRYSPDGETAFGDTDIMIRTILLSCTLGIAFLKKHFLQKSQQHRYASYKANQENSAKLYHILEYMLPEHVIMPLLTEPDKPWSQPIETVTILFLVIDDFESIVQAKSPAKLLHFLNETFTKMDAICKYTNVTKIETVGEEYVCCVGVMPADVEETENDGHSVVLGRLFRAADDMMRLQSKSMRFKIGMHTGPIVAGVIGRKLPRFRLFGDTINTAARMMQKGVVGQVQFGEQTLKHKPEDVEAIPRGKVEMKGKGQVETFLFTGTQSDATPGDATGSVTETASMKLGRKVFFEGESENDKQAFSTERSEPVPPPTPRGLLNILLASRKTLGSMLDMTSEQTSASAARLPADSRSRKRMATSSSVNMDFGDVVDSMQLNMAQKAMEANKPDQTARSFRILSEKDGFDEEMEETWFREYFEEILCNKLHPRIDKFILCVFVITVVEVLWNVPNPHHPELAGWDKSHDAFGTRFRLPMFIACRVGVMLILGGLRYAASAGDWLWEHPKQFQRAYVGVSSSAILLLYLSYDVMIVGKTVNTDGGLVAPADQIFSLGFVLLFFLIIRDRMLFYYSLAYIPLSLVIVGFSSIRSNSGVYFPLIGQVLFVIIAISNSVLAHAEEQSQRARFKALHAMETTKHRITNILQSMMPPAVLAEIHNSPAGTLPSHQYEAATIAQSDLCGFTALASTRTPAEVVEFISELFGLFDDLSNDHGIYKVETVGDAYIAGQAEMPLTTVNSPTSVIRFAIGMVIKVISWAEKNGVKVQCRVGVHHGHCLGGIVGHDMQRYHIFGALMQGLEVLESTAPEGGVQISSACHQAVLREWEEDKSNDKVFDFKPREGQELVTSKGEAHSFEEVGGRTFVVQGHALLKG